MKTLLQRADAHHEKGGHDESWLAGYMAAVRDMARSKRILRTAENTRYQRCAFCDAEKGAPHRAGCRYSQRIKGVRE